MKKLFIFLSQRHFRKIRHRVANNKICVSIDEMTDDGGRYAANVDIGTHFADRSGDIYLLNSCDNERSFSSCKTILSGNRR
jgi:hypothetical protein